MGFKRRGEKLWRNKTHFDNAVTQRISHILPGEFLSFGCEHPTLVSPVHEDTLLAKKRLQEANYPFTIYDILIALETDLYGALNTGQHSPLAGRNSNPTTQDLRVFRSMQKSFAWRRTLKKLRTAVDKKLEQLISEIGQEQRQLVYVFHDEHGEQTIAARLAISQEETNALRLFRDGAEALCNAQPPPGLAHHRPYMHLFCSGISVLRSSGFTYQRIAALILRAPSEWAPSPIDHVAKEYQSLVATTLDPGAPIEALVSSLQTWMSRYSDDASQDLVKK